VLNSLSTSFSNLGEKSLEEIPISQNKNNVTFKKQFKNPFQNLNDPQVKMVLLVVLNSRKHQVFREIK
jgi:hypothetical protein